jgi:hypothetical protein
MKNAPLLSELRTKGGTLLTFSTTTDDFSYLLSNSDITITPSHFALLKLPQWENTLDQSLFFDGTTFLPSITDANLVFPKVVQNYIENLLSYSEANRTDNSLGNYAEQSFIKMLQLLGGVSFTSTGTTLINGTPHNVYVEDLTSNDQVVQYIGETNMINHRKTDDGEEFVEVYINIPTEQGLMTNIRFIPNVAVTHNSGLIPSGGGDTYTQGLSAFAGTDQVEAIYDTVGDEYSVGSDPTDLTIDFEYSLDDTANHKQGDFDFNAVLIYYTASDKTGVIDSQRNCWGLHLVENFGTSIGGVSTIPSLTKYQPDNIQSGNAYNFKFNLGFSAGTYNISTTTNSDFSFQLYLDALDRLNNVLTEVEKIKSEWATLQDTIINFSTAIGNFNTIQEATDSIASLTSDVEQLKSWQSGDNGVRITNEELFKLFQTTSNALANATGDVKIYPILSSRTFLPNVVDVAQLIVEYNGLYYKYNQSTEAWETYTI